MKLRYFSLIILLLSSSLTITASAQETCMNCSTIPEKVDINYMLQWDQIPDTINASQSRILSVKSDLTQFTWTVSGTGFWFDSQHTSTTIENTDAKAVSLYAASNACGTATVTVRGHTDNPDENYSILGRLKGNAGRWSAWELVDEKYAADYCPGGATSCGGFPGSNSTNPCQSVTNVYQYYAYWCFPWSQSGCNYPGCSAGGNPTCNDGGDACSITLTDGICTFTKSTFNACTGLYYMSLDRQEWICN